MRNELLRRALSDPETGLPNNRFFELEQERVVARSLRYAFPVAVVTISCRGCVPGVLRGFFMRAAGAVRRADLLARTGPNELRLIVTHDDIGGVPELVERLRTLAAEFAPAGQAIEIAHRIDTVPAH